MKVLVFVKATPNSEKGILPNDEQLSKMFADMGKFNEQLVKAGIMTEADGLKPSSAGKRVTFSDQGHTAVVDGPFAETKELVAGYWTKHSNGRNAARTRCRAKRACWIFARHTVPKSSMNF
jgi:hypothetical protein